MTHNSPDSNPWFPYETKYDYMNSRPQRGRNNGGGCMIYLVFFIAGSFISCDKKSNHPIVESSDQLIFIPLNDTIQDLCYDPRFWYVYKNEKLNYIAQSTEHTPVFKNKIVQISINCPFYKNRLHTNVKK